MIVAAISDRRTSVRDRRYSPDTSVRDRRYNPVTSVRDRRYNPVTSVRDRRYNPDTSVRDRRYSPDTSVRDRRYNMKYKPRLRRLDWLYTDNPIYYLTLCTVNRMRVLANPEIHQEFRQFSQRAADYHVLVGLFMIMPDHIHLFAAFCPKSPALWKWVKALRGSLSKRLRETRGEGTHWEKDFFDHVMRTEESYLEKLEYVRQNPVRAGLVKRPEDWPYQGEVHRLVFPKKL